MPVPAIPVTRTDLRLARLPAGAARDRIRRLAKAGADICHRWKYGTLAEICDSLGLALKELGNVERELSVARMQIGQLQQEMAKLRAEGFDAPTRTVATADLRPVGEEP